MGRRKPENYPRAGERGSSSAPPRGSTSDTHLSEARRAREKDPDLPLPGCWDPAEAMKCYGHKDRFVSLFRACFLICKMGMKFTVIGPGPGQWYHTACMIHIDSNSSTLISTAGAGWRAVYMWLQGIHWLQCLRQRWNWDAREPSATSRSHLQPGRETQARKSTRHRSALRHPPSPQQLTTFPCLFITACHDHGPLCASGDTLATSLAGLVSEQIPFLLRTAKQG